MNEMNFSGSIDNQGFPPGLECSICKGRCCKEKGCSLSPEDLMQALWDRTTQGNTTQESATQESTTQESVTQESATQGNTTQENTTQENATQESATQGNTTQENTTQGNATQENTEQDTADQTIADQDAEIQATAGRNFQIEETSLVDFLKASDCLYAIDLYTDEAGPLYYLRMRHKCYTFIGVDAIGECIALTPEGCSLSDEERPKGGRFLRSSRDFHCVQTYTAAMMRKDWQPYQDLLHKIWVQYEAKFTEDGTFEACDEAYFAWMRKQREKD